MRLMITGAAGEPSRDLQEVLADHDIIPLDHVTLALDAYLRRPSIASPD
jgi:hypothetical protein